MPTRERLFFDTEFTGLHQATTLISLGIVSESGKTFYAEFTDYALEQVEEWVEKNVIQQLQLQEFSANYIDKASNAHWSVKGDSEWVKTQLLDFLELFGAVEFWSDNLAYDWVLFCQLFGHATQIPSQVYYIPFDLATLFHLKGIDPDIKRSDFVKAEISALGKLNPHHALWDAQVLRKCFEKAIKI